MTTYTAKNAKPQPGRRRAAPRLVPTPVMLLALWLGVLSAWVPAPYSRPLGALAVAGGVAYFVQKWRRAGWDLAQSARAELDR